MYPKDVQKATTKNKIVATVNKPSYENAVLWRLFFMICNDTGPTV